MFGLFASDCPVEEDVKALIESKLAWICRAFGAEKLLQTDIVTIDQLVTAGFEFEPSQKRLRELVDELCQLMNISPREIVIRIASGLADQGYDSGYEPTQNGGIIHVAESKMEDLETLITFLAHCLACHMLVHSGKLGEQDPYYDFVAEILMVFFGFGGFLANSTIRESYEGDGTVSSWSASRSGSLSAIEIGYTLALCAWFRGDDTRKWNRFLRLDARASLKRGLKFLQKGGDSLFNKNEFIDPSDASDSQLLNNLRSNETTLKIVSLWNLQDRVLKSKECIETALSVVQEDNFLLRAEAIRLLGMIADDSDVQVFTALNGCLSDFRPEVRAMAAMAIGLIQFDSPEAELALCNATEDEHRQVICEAIEACMHSCRDAEQLPGRILKALDRSLTSRYYEVTERALLALIVIFGDPKPAMKAHFKKPNCNRYQRCLDALADLKSQIDDIEHHKGERI